MAKRAKDGRPTSKTPSTPTFAARFFFAYQRFGSWSMALKSVGWSVAGLSRARRAWPDFDDLCVAAEEDYQARRDGSQEQYVLTHLSQEARQTWEAMLFWLPNTKGHQKARALAQSKDVKIRQGLFIQALLHTRYNPSRAKIFVGVSDSEMNAWLKDPDFVDLVEQVKSHRKDFVEEKLMKLVENDDPKAIIFANETINKERGYSRRVELEGLSEDAVRASAETDILELDLPVETLRVVARALAKKHRENKVVQLPNIDEYETNGNTNETTRDLLRP